MKDKIFICYRRDDSAGHSGRLYDSLSSYFGPDRVFMDLHRIQGGDHFAEVIEDTLEGAGAVLVVIGRNWLVVNEETGKPRLEAPGDYVHLEIATALSANTPVIPVLVQGARIPRDEALPSDVRSLVHLNAVLISDEQWGPDIKRLAKILELDVRGSLAERRFNYLKKWVLGLLFISVSLAVTREVAIRRTFDYTTSLIIFLFIYTNLLVMAAASILLALAARSAEETSRRLMWGSLILAAVSVLLIAIGLGTFSVLTNAAILVALSLATFKPT